MKLFGSKLLIKAHIHRLGLNSDNPYFPSISEIIPGFLYISNLALIELHPNFVNYLRIKYVLSVVSEDVFQLIENCKTAKKVHLKHLAISDYTDQQILDYFDEAHQFIEEAKAHHKRILIHCEQGISRSPTIVISYLMKYHHKTLREALNLVKERRPIASPNIGFMHQLQAYEELLHERRHEQTTNIFEAES